MSLPPVPLDDLHFQPLVEECRKRIAARCPEWTEVNVSDPGITLIEQFAWMIDQLSYRVNRIPEKLQVALLSLLDIGLLPPQAATADLRFGLEKPATAPITIPSWTTQVSTARTAAADPIVFAVSTESDFTIRPVQLRFFVLQGYQLGRWQLEELEVQENGIALPNRHAFSPRPVPGEGFLLGFVSNLERLVIRVNVNCTQATGTGVDPDDPPLQWAVWTGEAGVPGEWWAGSQGWQSLAPNPDTTLGFNKTDGFIELALPPTLGRRALGGHEAQWLRCTLIEHDSAHYDEPPLIEELHVDVMGASLPAMHAQRVEQGEVLGVSDGTAGQVMQVRRAPMLPLDPALQEWIEVNEGPATFAPRANGNRAETVAWTAWKEVDTFARSEPGDRDVKIDAAAGEIEFGPAVRDDDGTFRQHGAIPRSGAQVRVSRYRIGGGRIGNVSPRTLTRLRAPIDGVNSVTNPDAAHGGADQETLASAKARAAMRLARRDRAITGEDFEILARAVPQHPIARVRCRAPQPGLAELLVIPPVTAPERLEPLSLEQLTPDATLKDGLTSYLAPKAVIGVNLTVSAPRYQIVTVVASITACAWANADLVARGVKQRLYRYLNPLIGGTDGKGWAFGRTLTRSELEWVVRSDEAIASLAFLKLFAHDQESRKLIETERDAIGLSDDQLIVSGRHSIRVVLEAVQ